MSLLSQLWKNNIVGVRGIPYPFGNTGGSDVQPFQGNNPVVPQVADTKNSVPPVDKKQIFKGNNVSSSNTVGDPSKFLDADGKLLHPDVFAQNVANGLPGGDIPKYTGDVAINPNETTMQLNQRQAGLTNTANDLATGTTDPYKVGAQSGINYSPQELNAIEKAYAGIYDPAINDVHAKLQAKQDEDKMTKQFQYDLALKNAGNSSLNGLTLGDYAKQTSSGNSYIDLSTVTDKNEKKLVENAARLNRIPIVTDANASKINAIEDTRTNLDNIKAQFDKIGYQGGGTKTAGGFGLSNRIAGLFGDTNVGSFKAWRTAAINSVQALAGGQGSGLRINQAEINAAMENDIPTISDTIPVGEAKMENLKKQLDNWEEILLGTKGSNSNNKSTDSLPPTMVLNGQTLTLQADGTYQ